jgi:peptide/nickel transport system ATP-binding protein
MVEYSDTDSLFSKPLHPYTKALFSAIPMPDPDYKMERVILEGSIPSPANPPSGCKFHTRCRECMEICKNTVPVYRVGRKKAITAHCHLYNDSDTAPASHEDIEIQNAKS